jgi:hypothetical protein
MGAIANAMVEWCIFILHFRTYHFSLAFELMYRNFMKCFAITVTFYSQPLKYAGGTPPPIATILDDCRRLKTIKF